MEADQGQALGIALCFFKEGLNMYQYLDRCNCHDGKHSGPPVSLGFSQANGNFLGIHETT